MLSAKSLLVSKVTDLMLSSSPAEVLEGELVLDVPAHSLEVLHQTRPLINTDVAGTVLRQHSGTGRRTYESRLNQAAEAWEFEMVIDESLPLRQQQALRRERYKLVPWHVVRSWHLEALKASLRDQKKGFNTINLTLAACKAVCKQVFQTGLMSGEDYMRVTLVKRESGKRLPKGRNVTQGEIYAIVNACSRDVSAAGRRDTAILALLYACGLRRREVAELEMKNLRPQEGVIQFVGKKNKERKTYPGDSVINAINRWIKDRGDHAGRLFCPINKAGKVDKARGLSDQSVYNVVVKRIREAELANKTTPHDLRRSFATELLEKGHDLKVVSQLMGHASVETTSVYDLRDEGARKKAQATIHWPEIKPE